MNMRTREQFSPNIYMIILENDIMLPSIMEESENDEHADNNKM